MKLAPGLTQVEDAALRLFIEGLRASLLDRLESVFLFGSKARGRAPATSDTDVAVVISGRKSPALRLAVADPAFEPMARFGVDISPLIVTSADFHSDLPLSKNIRKEGILLWPKRKNSSNAV